VRSRGLAVGTALVLVSLAVALAVERGGSPPAGEVRPTPGEAPPTLAPVSPPVVPEKLRDIFRFADEGAVSRPAMPELVSDDSAPSAPAPLAFRPRLVGLVWRSGHLLAALAVDGEVVLAGPGESVAGVSVVSVGEESVRIREVDGTESTLVLP